MMNDHEALAAMRTWIRRGAYQEAESFADSLLPEIKRRPLIALERARAFLRQGDPIRAESALATANLSWATPGEQLIFAIEAASLLVYRHVAIRAALAAATSAFAKSRHSHLDPADRAEAERVHIRILLSAATYHEINLNEAQAGRDRLPAVAEILEQAGRIDEGLAARLTYAERLDPPRARIEALHKLAQHAITANRPAVAGEAQLLCGEHLLAAGGASEEIRAALESAAQLYAQSNHVHGLVDVQRVSARLAIERELASPQILEACLAAYRQMGFYRGMLNVLMDLSQLAHEHGDTASAAAYRSQMLVLAETVGMGLVRDSFQTAQIDLMMRHADYGAALELCQSALAADPPAMSKAGYEQLLATAYSFINAWDSACSHGRKAIAMYEDVGALDAASDAVMKLASDLSSLRREETWNEAEQLLEAWALKDEQRKDFSAAINKRELIAQTKIERFLYSTARRSEPVLINEAEAALAVAEALTQRLTEREAARRRGSLAQLRGQIHQARGEQEQVIQTLRKAFSIYDQAGFAMESANCRYLLGALYLNRANQELLPNFAEAENHLRAALAYYEGAGMRSQASDTRFMFARLYVNASLPAPRELATQLLDTALEHLRAGEADYDALRREFNAGASVLEVQHGKRALIVKSRRIYELALEIHCLTRPEPAPAWDWAQRAKARALSDILGTGTTPPARIMSELEKHPDAYRLAMQERELAARINKVTPQERVALRGELHAHWERMRQDSRLGDYLEIRAGAALDAVDLQTMTTEETQAGRACVCVDWVAVGERLFLVAVRPGQAPQLQPLPLRLGAVRAFVRDNFAPENFRMTLRDAPETLHVLAALIAPLARLSAPEELLILSPTGPLHALPLHALEIDGAPLLVRNPVVYCPSLSVLRHCVSRRRDESARFTATILGDPHGDRPEAAKFVAHLGQHFGTTPLLKEHVTRVAFVESISECDLLHFQGHAVHQPDEPLASYLALADGNFTAKDVFALPQVQADLVALAACESAANVIATGDEPLGLIPAFLYAGANSVLATLWRVHQTSAAQAMRFFYDLLAQADTKVDKAQALRRALLAVRATPGFERPYHWAPFALYGDWRFQKRGERR